MSESKSGKNGQSDSGSAWIQEIVLKYLSPGPWIFWRQLFDLYAEARQFTSRPTTDILKALLEVKPRSGADLYYAADSVLKIHRGVNSSWDTNDIRLALWHGANFVANLRSEMPQKETRRAIIRWLKRASGKTRYTILSGLVFNPIEDRMELVKESAIFVEELVGPKAWKIICTHQDPKKSLAKYQVEGTNGPSYFTMPRNSEESAEFDFLEKSTRTPHLTRHDPNIAEAFEDLIEKSGETINQVSYILEESLDIVSGDLIMPVTHLRDEWMQVSRRAVEVCGVILPRIDVARHKQFGDSGAACRFRIPFPDEPKKVLRGSLDPEGELTLENAPLLDKATQLSVRAAVAQTLCAVLVPTLADELPSRPESSGPSIITEEPWASRPIIHTIGKFGNTRGIRQPPVTGSRLNPHIAIRLFVWLLEGVRDDAFKLFTETEDVVARKPEKYFIARKGARELLLKRQLGLSKIHIRVVRAHTRPLPPYLDDEGKIHVKQMSPRALRNYRRYRENGGRELNFSPVQKTYIMPDSNVQVPIEVLRTFNHGCFVSLDDALELIFDEKLKSAVLKRFVG